MESKYKLPLTKTVRQSDLANYIIKTKDILWKSWIKIKKVILSPFVSYEHIWNWNTREIQYITCIIL